MKTKILNAGLVLYPDVTITTIAEYLNTSKPSVHYHFKADEIRAAVEEHAVQKDNQRVISKMIALKSDRVAHWDKRAKLIYLVDSV